MKLPFFYIFLFSSVFFTGCSLDESLESSGALDRDDTDIFEEVGPQFLDQAFDLIWQKENTEHSVKDNTSDDLQEIIQTENEKPTQIELQSPLQDSSPQAATQQSVPQKQTTPVVKPIQSPAPPATEIIIQKSPEKQGKTYEDDDESEHDDD